MLQNPPPVPFRRDTRAGRVVLFGLAGIVFVALLALLAAVVLFDPNAYRPEIAAAVKRATGRDFAIGGPIGIAFGLTPVLTVNDAVLANSPSGSQTEMASVRRAEAEIALLPLLSRQVVISRLVLVQPKLLLERDANGQPNWLFSRPVRAETGAGTVPDQPQPSAAGLSVRSVLVRDGEVRWRANQRSAITTIALGRLEASLGTQGDPATARADLAANGVAAAVDLATGPLAQLRTATSWPVRATITGSAGRIAVSGTMDRPAEFGGYRFAVEGASADLAALRPLLPITLPPLHDVTMSALVQDDQGKPVWSALKLHAGGSTLEAILPGLLLERLEASADSLSQPLRIDAGGSFLKVPIAIAGTLPSPAALAGTGDAARSGFDIAGSLASGTLAARGEIGNVARLTGLAMTLKARLPDLADVARVTDTALPAFRDIAFDGEVSDVDGGLSRGFALSGATLNTAQGDVSGNATILVRGKPSVTARLASKRIDVDALIAAIDPSFALKRPPPEPPAPAPRIAPATPATAEGAQVPAPPSAPAPPLPKLILPSRQIHLDFLQQLDLDIDERAAVMHAFGTDYRDVAGHLVVRGAKLTLDPFTGQTPGGALSGTLAVDGGAPDHPLTVTLHAPAVALRPLLAGFGLPNAVDGIAELDVDLRGSSRSPHDLAADATGRVALAMVDGDIDNALLARLAGDLMHTARAAEITGEAGRTRLRCLAARLDLSHGTASIATLLLDTSRLMLVGSGTATMGDEALALHLRPLLRVGGPGITVPIRIGGMLGAPKIGLDTAGLADGLLGGRAPTPSPGAVLAEARGDPCPAALAAARDGRPGALPAEPPAPAPAASAKPPNAAQLLRGLVR